MERSGVAMRWGMWQGRMVIAGLTFQRQPWGRWCSVGFGGSRMVQGSDLLDTRLGYEQLVQQKPRD